MVGQVPPPSCYFFYCYAEQYKDVVHEDAIKAETKPEVKKAGRVYYTPQYIVDYIVGTAVGKLVAGKTPGEIAEIKILDPACGSGSFLIGAYTYLLKYHPDWYVENKPKKHKKAGFQVRENEKAPDNG